MRTRPGLRLTLALAAALVAAGCADGDEPDAPAPTVTVTETVTAAPPANGPDDGTPPDVCQEALEEGGEGLAFVFVTEPVPGQAVQPGFTVAGCSNSFEATYQWELLARDGSVLAEGFGTATCGTGCVGDLSFTVGDWSVDAEQVGTLRVFTASAEDGSELEVNAIPLRLRP